MAEGDTLWLPNSVMRQESTIPATRADMLAHVRGYFVPIYVDRHPDGRRVALLREKDGQRIKEGYGCGECLAYFDRQFPECPSCGHELDASRDVVDFNPDYWQPHDGRTSAEILKDNG